jgi:lipoate-protein ligase A
LSGNDTSAISNLAETRYRSWEWNYAYGPGYTFNKIIKIKDENVTIEMSVKNGLITGCSIEGDSVLSNAAGNLSGCRHMPGEIRDKFKKEKISLTDKTIFTFF